MKLIECKNFFIISSPAHILAIREQRSVEETHKPSAREALDRLIGMYTLSDIAYSPKLYALYLFLIFQISVFLIIRSED